MRVKLLDQGFLNTNLPFASEESSPNTVFHQTIPRILCFEKAQAVHAKFILGAFRGR